MTQWIFGKAAFLSVETYFAYKHSDKIIQIIEEWVVQTYKATYTTQGIIACSISGLTPYTGSNNVICGSSHHETCTKHNNGCVEMKHK